MDEKNDHNMQYPVAEYIDMGISVSWAKWNMGEDSEFEVSEGFGWGDILGYGDYSTLDNYPSPFPPETISGTEYDVAKVRWGEGWRLPQDEDFLELWNNSDVTIGEYAGTTYFRFMSKINGNVVYFPIGNTFESASYWTGELFDKDTRCAISIHFNDNDPSFSWEYLLRNKKACIRPVYEHRRVKTLDATEITAKSAKLNGEISYLASLNVEEVGFYISDDIKEINDPDEDTPKIQANRDNKDISAVVTNLSRNKKYYFKSYVVFNGTSYLGDINEFASLNAYEVGDLYPDDVNPIGVVFSIKNKGLNGKIVSLDQTSLEWQHNVPRYVNANDLDYGAANEFPSDSPIPNWIKTHGDGWYCPAKNELRSLCSSVGLVNKALKDIERAPIEGIYWSSTQYSLERYDWAWVVFVTEYETYMGYYAGYSTYFSKWGNTCEVVAIKIF